MRSRISSSAGAPGPVVRIRFHSVFDRYGAFSA